jgi:hypothetical protein
MAIVLFRSHFCDGDYSRIQQISPLLAAGLALRCGRAADWESSAVTGASSSDGALANTDRIATATGTEAHSSVEENARAMPDPHIGMLCDRVITVALLGWRRGWIGGF